MAAMCLTPRNVMMVLPLFPFSPPLLCHPGPASGYYSFFVAIGFYFFHREKLRSLTWSPLRSLAPAIEFFRFIQAWRAHTSRRDLLWCSILPLSLLTYVSFFLATQFSCMWPYALLLLLFTYSTAVTAGCLRGPATCIAVCSTDGSGWV